MISLGRHQLQTISLGLRRQYSPYEDGYYGGGGDMMGAVGGWAEGGTVIEVGYMLSILLLERRMYLMGIA